MSNVPYIQMKGIVKTFGKLVANHNVNLTINGGEVHALLGENGAGKSTLMNMLSGIYVPDGGSIFVHGKEVKFSSPKDAIDAGVGMVHQHFKLVEVMTALENIMLGQKSSFVLNKKKVFEKVSEIAVRYALDLDLNKRVYDMSVGERQILEILKVLYRGADILILDEPTTVFTPQEAAKLFKIMRKMKEQGCALVFISHKMDEVMEISDKITVLRKGESITTLNKIDTNPKELADLMVGRAVDLSIKRTMSNSEKVVLKINDLTALDQEGIEVLKRVSLEVKAGEILGIAGIASSGQKELCEAIVGMHPIKSGEVVFENENLKGKSTREIVAKGISISFIPEDRLGMGLVGSMGMVDNLLLKDYHKQKGFLVDRKSVAKKCEEVVEKLEVKTPSIHYPIKNLSGGNIQKVLLGRELDSNPKLLMMAYPVRGLDINTCYTIYDLVNREKNKGVAVLFIGEDLDVLIQLCDRIAVMCRGEITGVVNAEGITKEELGLLMVGQKKAETEGIKVV